MHKLAYRANTPKLRADLREQPTDSPKLCSLNLGIPDSWNLLNSFWVPAGSWSLKRVLSLTF